MSEDRPTDPARWARLEALWRAAEAPPEPEQDVHSDTAAADDAGLAEELESLRSCAPDAEVFFRRLAGAVDDAATALGATEADFDEAGQLERLRANLASRYTIERELGRGGMATVHLALDLRHERKVALKVLRPELTFALGPDRFLREIKVTAGLDHPHILPLLDSGDADGVLYYVMPFVEGESLRDRLDREKQLPIEDAIQIAREVADALDYAHRANVVHRDIKSDNILLAAGHARVSDFGIARAISAAGGGDGMTQAGLAVGTPETMSPEQAAGDPEVDGRSDIYSLGCVLYEMLAGQPPFTGASALSVVRQHMTTDPTPITKLRAAVPASVAEALTRSLAKDPADRYSTASDFARALRTAGQPRLRRPLAVAALFGVVSLLVLAVAYVLMIQLGLPGWVVPATIALLVAGLPIVTTTAIVQRRRGTRPAGGIRRWLTWRRSLAGGALAFAGLAAVTTIYLAMRTLGIGPVGTLLARGALERGDRIVLADFQNGPEDPTLGSSVTEALRVDLGQSRVVDLIDASAVDEALSRMGRALPARIDATVAREVAERVGGAAVITGEIRRLGAGYLLLASLLSPTSGEVLASARETAADEGDIISALDRLSSHLRDRIGEPLKAIRATPSLAQVTTPSLAALRKYSQAETLRGVDVAGRLSLLEEAVALDTAFAMAYRGIGVALGNLGLSRSRSIEARRKAFQYRDRLTERERLITMGSYYTGVTGELDKARAAYEGLVEAYPDDVGGWHNLGLVFGEQRQFERAETCYLRALELGADASTLNNLVNVQVALGTFDAAQTTLDRLAAANPESSDYFDQAARLAYARGDYAGALSFLQDLARVGGPVARGRALSHVSAVLAVGGRLAEAARYRSQAADLFAQVGAGRDFLIATATGSTIGRMLGEDADVATQVVEAALGEFPLDSLDPLERPYLDLALFYALSDRTARARELVSAWEERVEADLRRGDEPSRLFVQGVIALSEHRPADAVARLRDALAAEPALPPQVVLPLLGRAWEAAGQPDSAVAAYEESIGSTLERFNASAMSMLAGAHHADAAWRADTYERLGDLYEHRGDRAEVADWYTRFLDLWKGADPELQPRIAAVKERLARLAGEPR